MDCGIWGGRQDFDSAGDARRLCDVVAPFDTSSEGHTALIGFACDEGVRRNH